MTRGAGSGSAGVDASAPVTAAAAAPRPSSARARAAARHDRKDGGPGGADGGSEGQESRGVGSDAAGDRDAEVPTTGAPEQPASDSPAGSDDEDSTQVSEPRALRAIRRRHGDGVSRAMKRLMLTHQDMKVFPKRHLRPFEALTFLDVSHNSLRSLPCRWIARCMPLLQELRAADNRLHDASALRPLGALPALSALDVSNNECARSRTQLLKFLFVVPEPPPSNAAERIMARRAERDSAEAHRFSGYAPVGSWRQKSRKPLAADKVPRQGVFPRLTLLCGVIITVGELRAADRALAAEADAELRRASAVRQGEADPRTAHKVPASPAPVVQGRSREWSWHHKNEFAAFVAPVVGGRRLKKSEQIRARQQAALAEAEEKANTAAVDARLAAFMESGHLDGEKEAAKAAASDVKMPGSEKRALLQQTILSMDGVGMLGKAMMKFASNTTASNKRAEALSDKWAALRKKGAFDLDSDDDDDDNLEEAKQARVRMWRRRRDGEQGGIFSAFDEVAEELVTTRALLEECKEYLGPKLKVVPQEVMRHRRRVDRMIQRNEMKLAATEDSGGWLLWEVFSKQKNRNDVAIAEAADEAAHAAVAAGGGQADRRRRARDAEAAQGDAAALSGDAPGQTTSRRPVSAPPTRDPKIEAAAQNATISKSTDTERVQTEFDRYVKNTPAGEGSSHTLESLQSRLQRMTVDEIDTEMRRMHLRNAVDMSSSTNTTKLRNPNALLEKLVNEDQDMAVRDMRERELRAHRRRVEAIAKRGSGTAPARRRPGTFRKADLGKPPRGSAAAGASGAEGTKSSAKAGGSAVASRLRAAAGAAAFAGASPSKQRKGAGGVSTSKERRDVAKHEPTPLAALSQPGGCAPSKLRNVGPITADEALQLHPIAVPTRNGWVGKGPDNKWWEQVQTVEDVIEEVKGEGSARRALRDNLLEVTSAIRRRAPKDLERLAEHHKAFIRGQLEYEATRRDPLYLVSAAIEDAQRPMKDKTVTVGEKKLVFSELFL